MGLSPGPGDDFQSEINALDLPVISEETKLNLKLRLEDVEVAINNLLGKCESYRTQLDSPWIPPERRSQLDRDFTSAYDKMFYLSVCQWILDTLIEGVSHTQEVYEKVKQEAGRLGMEDRFDQFFINAWKQVFQGIE